MTARVAVYGSALTAQDVTSHFQGAELGPPPSSTAPPAMAVSSPPNGSAYGGTWPVRSAADSGHDGVVTWTSSSPSIATITFADIATTAKVGRYHDLRRFGRGDGEHLADRNELASARAWAGEAPDVVRPSPVSQVSSFRVDAAGSLHGDGQRAWMGSADGGK